MSVVSSSSSRVHRVHYFHFSQPEDLNATIVRGYTARLISSSSGKAVGFVIVNGNTNFIGPQGSTNYSEYKEINQVNMSILLENGSLSLNTQFHFSRDGVGKIQFPTKIFARDQNAKMVLIMLSQNESDLEKISVGLQHI